MVLYRDKMYRDKMCRDKNRTIQSIQCRTMQLKLPTQLYLN
jgi:hypothetical protein